jgi:hypothetical protein
LESDSGRDLIRPLLFHQGFQQRHRFWERIGAPANTSGAPGNVQGRAPGSVFGSQVSTVGD